MLQVPPEEESGQNRSFITEKPLTKLLSLDCQQCKTAIEDSTSAIPPEMRIEKQINSEMLKRCNQALDNSQDLINFYYKLTKKVEK